LRLLRQVPAITELALIDQSGREQLRVSRVARDVVGSGRELSGEPAFIEARALKTYFGPGFFRRSSEPYLSLAHAGDRCDSGVVVAEVDLIFVWDVISQIKVGEHGKAYVLDAGGRLIAHPDIDLVLRNTDFSNLPHVQAARTGEASEDATAADMHGRPMLAAHSAIPPLGWLLFVAPPLARAH